MVSVHFSQTSNLIMSLNYYSSEVTPLRTHSRVYPSLVSHTDPSGCTLAAPRFAPRPRPCNTPGSTIVTAPPQSLVPQYTWLNPLEPMWLRVHGTFHYMLLTESFPKLFARKHNSVTHPPISTSSVHASVIFSSSPIFKFYGKYF